MSNRKLKKSNEKRLAIRLQEYCEVLNPPEYRRKDFASGKTLSETASIVDKTPNYILDEIRQGRLTATVIDGKVRIQTKHFLEWTNR